MTAVLALGVALGLDSLQVSLMLGATIGSRRRLWVLAAGFALGDGLATWLGTTIGARLPVGFDKITPWLAAAALAVYVAAVIRTKTADEDLPGVTLFLVPAALSLDNVFAGLALGALDRGEFVVPVVIGAMSGGMALVGLLGGQRVAALIPRAKLVAATLLMVSAVVTIAQG